MSAPASTPGIVSWIALTRIAYLDRAPIDLDVRYEAVLWTPNGADEPNVMLLRATVEDRTSPRFNGRDVTREVEASADLVAIRDAAITMASRAAPKPSRRSR